MSVNTIKNLGTLWDAARADQSPQGYSVSYGEVKGMEEALAADDEKIDRGEAQALAQNISEDTFLTAPAEREVRELFTGLLGPNHRFDAVTVDAVKADFSMRAADPFRALAVPGRKLTSEETLAALPSPVRTALGELVDKDGFAWEESEVRTANLAGQDVYIVHHTSDSDPEKVAVFSPSGRELAQGGIDDGMAGFFWK